MRRIRLAGAFVLLAAVLGIHIGPVAAANPAPTIAANGVSPPAANNTSTAQLSVTGTNFVSGATVTLELGATVLTAPSPSVDSATHISNAVFDLTGQTPGTWTLRVKNPDMQSATAPFHVQGTQPSIGSISPATGGQGSTVNVVITGTNLARGDKVTFNDGDDPPSPLPDSTPNPTPGTVVWDSVNQIHFALVIAANAKVGADDVTVTNADDSFATTKKGGFAVTAASAVTPTTPKSINPNTQPNTGTTGNIVICGDNFHATVVAQLEKAGQTPIVMKSPVVSTPPNSLGDCSGAMDPQIDEIKGTFDLTLAPPGSWNLRVTNSDDKGTGTLASAFTISGSQPTISSVVPAQGYRGDPALTVTISGSGFAKGPTLSFGSGISVSSVNVPSATSMTAVLNVCQGAATGLHDLTVTNSDGQSSTKTGAFTVPDPPAQYSYQAYASGFNGGASVAAGELVPGCGDDVVTGAGPGGGPHVIVAKPNQGSSGGALVVASFLAFDPGFRGGVRVAVGEFDGNPADGKELLTAAGPGGGPEVRVWKVGADGSVTLLQHFFAYDPAFTGGVFVAAGDTDNNAANGDEIVTGAGAGGGPDVEVFSASGVRKSGFFPYDKGFTGGVSVAVASFPSSHLIVTGAGPGGGPDVEVYSAAGVRATGFFAYSPNFTGGVSVAAGNVLGPGTDQIITGPGPGGGPDVEIFSGSSNLGKGFLIYPSTFTGGVNVAVGDTDGDGVREVIGAPWTGGPILVLGNRIS